MTEGISLNSEAKRRLHELLSHIEAKLDADVLSLFGPITFGVERKVRDAIEPIPDRRQRLAVILHTGGGIVEIAERMVNVIRHHYSDVTFASQSVSSRRPKPAVLQMRSSRS